MYLKVGRVDEVVEEVEDVVAAIESPFLFPSRVSPPSSFSSVFFACGIVSAQAG